MMPFKNAGLVAAREMKLGAFAKPVRAACLGCFLDTVGDSRWLVVKVSGILSWKTLRIAPARWIFRNSGEGISISFLESAAGKTLARKAWPD